MLKKSDKIIRSRQDSRRILGLWVCGAFAAVCSITVLYYLLFPARGAFFSDTADTLYWAQASCDSGKIIDPDFYYATLLPFGGSLLMLPFFGLFGMSMTTHLIGMVLFVLLFMAALWFLCRTLPYGLKGRFLLFGTVLLGLSSSKKLREIMWEHTIYYSIGILLSLLMLGVIFLILFPKDNKDNGISRKGTGFFVALLALLGFLSGVDGPQVLVFCVFPVLAGLCAERFCNPKPLAWGKKRIGLLVVGALVGGAVLGLLATQIAFGGIETTYSDGNLVFCSPSHWSGNVLNIPLHWITLLGFGAASGETIVSIRGVAELFRLIVAVLLFCLPFSAALWYKKIESRKLRILLWYHWALSAVIIGSHVVGSTGSSNWRMTPMVASSLIVTVCLIHDIWIRRAKNGLVLRRAAALCIAVLMLFNFLNLVAIVSLKPDSYKDSQLYAVAELLENNGLTHGFSGFETAHSITVISNERVKSRLVEFAPEGVAPRLYQTRLSWYNEKSADGRYFLITSFNYYCEMMQYPAWQKLSEHELEQLHSDGFFIIVYDINIVFA
jgi:hypothetical protein